MPFEGFKTYVTELRDFLRAAREDGGIIGMMREGKVPQSYKRVFSKSADFIARHPYVAAAATTFAIMYAQGWFKSERLERMLSSESGTKSTSEAS